MKNLPLRHARQRDGAAAGTGPAATARWHHARRLGCLCHQWRPRLAAERSQPQGNHALWDHVSGRRRSLIRGAGTVGRLALGSAIAGYPSLW